MNARCPTTSGQYRCEREAGHTGDCEAQASEYAVARLPRVTLPGPPPTVPPVKEPSK